MILTDLQINIVMYFGTAADSYARHYFSDMYLKRNAGRKLDKDRRQYDPFLSEFLLLLIQFPILNSC